MSLFRCPFGIPDVCLHSEEEMNYWVITKDERAFGPYEDYATAYEFATTNLGFEGWTITTTSLSQ